MDIEAMARAAGSEAWDIWRDGRGALCVGLDGISLTEQLEKFAELVGAAECEACAKVCDELNDCSAAFLAEKIRERHNIKVRGDASRRPS